MLNLSSILLKFITLILTVEQNQSFPPPLSSDEEAELFSRMAGGDTRARDKLIEHNLRLVSHIVRKYYSCAESQDELISIGSIGLIKATDSFKCEFGTRFATYAARCIQNEILMFFRSQKKRESDISINDTIDIDKDGNPLTYMDVISSDECVSEEVFRKVEAERALKYVATRLTARERQIVEMRFGLCGSPALTQREIAERLHISRSYVSRIEKAAIEKLREAFHTGTV